MRIVMPAESIMVASFVTGVFAVFGLTLAGVVLYTSRDPRNRE
jgi:hypothetical protein